MENVKRLILKYGIFLILLIIMIGAAGVATKKKGDTPLKAVREELELPAGDENVTEEVTEDRYKKGYGLPVPKEELKEAGEDSISAMNSIQSIYRSGEKEIASNGGISNETAKRMMEVLQKTKHPVLGESFSLDMGNYKEMELFLDSCKAEIKGELVMYEIHTDGSIGRRKFIYDGRDMYELYTGVIWNKEGSPSIAISSLSRIKQWEYTKKGWLCIEYCVPEPPEVSEIVDGSSMLRVKPQKKEYKELEEKWLFPLSYQGNNLFFSSWSAGHMEKIDFNGLFEYLYMVKYQKEMDYGEYINGIPKDEFENMMTEYLPVTVDEIRKYAVFDEKNGTYGWTGLSCGNYTLTYFWTSKPEIIDMKENKDGTITLTIDAVCEPIGEDAVISHELTVELKEDGTLRYLKNQVLGDSLERIPPYWYRLG